jgi:dihydroxyacetone kinase
VTDFIEGLLYTNPNLVKVQGCNAVIHANITKIREQQVTLISGGGSGHEPAHASYIGNACIHGAVLGHVFASPSVQSIYNTIKIAAGPMGIILIVKNYTGDRLNFGMALEKAKQEGIHGKMIIVDDDCALAPGKGITGGRGIAGTVLVHKICGSLAANGHSVDSIYDFMQILLPNLRTMGVALSMCHLPNQTHFTSNRLSGTRSIEIGMGIHGEQGREQAELPETNAAKYISAILVEAILSRLGLLTSYLDEDREVVVLLNNLGCLPQLEMGIVMKEVVEHLLRNNCRPIRIFSGSFMTSLDMNGVSLSLLNLSTVGPEMQEQILFCLDQHVTAPAWSAATPLVSEASFDLSKRVIAPLGLQAPSSQNGTDEQAIFWIEPASMCVQMVRAICNKIISIEPQLSEFDAICGDGDCGDVMKKGAVAVLTVCDQLSLEQKVSVSRFLDTIANAVSESMGGTSGVLLEICFRSMSSYFSSKHHTGDSNKLWIGSIAAGIESIKYYGGADVGMRTMLDALIPAVESLKSGHNLDAATEAAMLGTEATKSMQSLAGRANYVAQEKMEGVADPGAFAISAAFEAAKICYNNL